MTIPIYYGCNRPLNHNQDTDTWQSSDGYTARKGVGQIIISDPQGRDVAWGIPLDLSGYSSVYVEVTRENGVHLFDAYSGMDRHQHTIGYFCGQISGGGAPLAIDGPQETGPAILASETIPLDIRHKWSQEMEAEEIVLPGEGEHWLKKYEVIKAPNGRYKVTLQIDGKIYSATGVAAKLARPDIVIAIGFTDGIPAKIGNPLISHAEPDNWANLKEDPHFEKDLTIAQLLGRIGQRNPDLAADLKLALDELRQNGTLDRDRAIRWLKKDFL